MYAGMPRSRAADARAAACLPEECVATPRRACDSDSANTALVAPRALKAPDFWKFSHLKYSRAPARASSVVLVSTGVTLTLPAMRSCASWMRFQVRPEGLPGMGASAWHALRAGQAGQGAGQRAPPRARSAVSVRGAHRNRAAVLARIEPGERGRDVHGRWIRRYRG